MDAPTARTLDPVNIDILPLLVEVDSELADGKRTFSLTIEEMLAAGRLSQTHYDLLVASGVSDEIVLERGYRTLTNPTQLEHLEPRFKGEAAKAARFPVLAYPVRRLGTDDIYCWVIRPDNPRASKKADNSGTRLAGEGKTLKPIKYEWPSKVSPICDVLPRHKDALANPSVPLYFTEGARKADAIASCGGVVVDLNGVYGFRGGNDKGGKALLPDFENIAFNDGREVYLAYDSDSKTNRQVVTALQRLEGIAVKGGARVYVLDLPHMSDGAKQGIDDYIGALEPERRTLEAFKPLIKDMRALARGSTSKAGKHYVTGAEMFNPPGWSNDYNMLAFTDPESGKSRVVYEGALAVTGWGRDYKTGDATLTVRFREHENHAPQVVSAPQVVLATAKGVLETLTRRGASIPESRAKDIARYLIDYARLNKEALTYTEHSGHYGYTGESIVGPGWSVGTETLYSGTTRIRRGDNAEAYRAALVEAATWNAKPLMLALGLAVASPHLERLNVTRNPVLWLSGDSNNGKTTALEFAVALYGKPDDLSMQSTRSTLAGFSQRLSVLRGLPMLIDETQTAEARRLQNVVYQYANGLSYARGGRDGQPLGNDTMSGAVFLAGEAPPQLTYQGARNRVLDLRIAENPPLGIGRDDTPTAGQLPGHERAAILKAAIDQSAGSLGYEVTRAVWDDWEAVAERVTMKEKKALGYIRTSQEWMRPLIAAGVGLEALFRVAGVSMEHYPKDLVPWAHKALCRARTENDPASTAFTELLALVNNAQEEYGSRAARLVRGERIAYYDSDNLDWLVVPGAKAVTEALHPFGGLQGLASQWVRRGWVTPDKRGIATLRRRIDGRQQRVLAIKDKIMRDGVEGDDMPS